MEFPSKPSVNSSEVRKNEQLEESNQSSSTTGEDWCGHGLVDALLSQVDAEALTEILSIQKKLLDRFEKTNEMLRTCNRLLEKRYEAARKEFSTYRSLIFQAKSDLESIFNRIRVLKQNLPEIQKPGNIDGD